jgi:hypothetical protein
MLNGGSDHANRGRDPSNVGWLMSQSLAHGRRELQTRRQAGDGL